jgi:monoamine oxidase
MGSPARKDGHRTNAKARKSVEAAAASVTDGQPAPFEAPVPLDVLATAQEGLEPRPQPAKRVIVIGGGLSGLVAAFELRRQGHEPVILEAQHRVGGRIYTLRDFAPGLYAEAGGMRIPRAHDLTLAYCDLFGLELRPFVMGNPKGLVFIGGDRMTAAEAEAQPERLPFDFAEHERGRTVNQLWDDATREIRAMVEREGPSAWDKIVRDYDKDSIREFMEAKGFSEGAIEAYGILNFAESGFNTAVVEELREDIGKAYVDMQEIVGGMDRLPNAFYNDLHDVIRFGAEVTSIDQDPRSVTVHYQTKFGRFSISGDYAVCSIPFSVLQTVEAIKPFSRGKQRAIRQLNYAASTKILLQVRRRRWEELDGIYGGATVTDLPIRRMNYPTPNPHNPRGILLASYTWGQDAARWGAMDNETRIEQALEDVARIHPWIGEEFEVGASHAWYDDPWARGAFALFEPEQQTNLQADIVAPEGRVHFAGEHTSLYHAWIQGALESGIRAAREIHEAAMVMQPVPEG